MTNIYPPKPGGLAVSGIPLRALRVRAIAVAGVAALILHPLLAAPNAAQAVNSSNHRTGHSLMSVNAYSRPAVVTAYQDWLQPALSVPVSWTGNTATCDMGTISDASRTATVAAVNFMRALAGLAPVVLDGHLSRNAQAAALIMSANGSLNHAPPADWACWTQAGFTAANRGNLAIGFGYPSINGKEPLAGSTGARAIASYMTDDGADNRHVHRIPYVTIKARHDQVAGRKDRCRRTEALHGESPERVKQADGTESNQNAAGKTEGLEA